MPTPRPDSHVAVTALLLALLIGLGAGGASAQDLAGERVTFVTSDGIELVADFYPPPAGADENPPVVILLHMFRHDRSTYKPLIPHLHKQGLAALALDSRGHGESTGPEEMRLPGRVAERDKSVFQAMHRDVAAAYWWLAQQDRVDLTRLGVVGASIGCSIALDYAVRDRSVDAVVCLSPPAPNALGLNTIALVRQTGERAVLVIANKDEREPADGLGRANPAVNLEVLRFPVKQPGAMHGTRMFGQETGVEDMIARFLADHLGPRSDAQPVAASIRGRVFYPKGAHAIGRLKPENVRWFSSAEEAEARGLKAAKIGSPAAETRPAEDGMP